MSYDYDALVEDFWKARQEAANETEQEAKRPHLVQAIQAAETLSSHCPMTPLLWIQYATAIGELVASGSSSIEYQTLQLGLMEFPGSILLHLRAMEVAPASEQTDCLEKAIQAVGQGSYRNEDHLVVQLYRKLAEITGDAQVFVRRSRCPMRQQNETLMAEFSSFIESKALGKPEEIVSAVEEGKKWEAKVLRQLATHEDSVEAVYHAQGLPTISLNDEGLVDWKLVMEGKELGMGMGGTDLSSAFIRYAKAFQRVRGEKGKFDPQELAVSVYERGVAECPTSESIWSAYISDLRRFRNGVERMAAVTERAVRNCPYSLRLAHQRIYAMEDLAAASMVVIGPDELFKLARECLDRKFLPPSASRELYIAAIMVMKRRILHIIASQGESSGNEKRKDKKKSLRYDDEEPLKQKGGKNKTRPLTDAEREEVEDLLEDLKEAYEDVIALLDSPYDKAVVLNDKAWSEAMLLTPLENALESESTNSASSVQFGTWDQALAAHQPPIPETCRLFIDMFALQRPVSSSMDVITRLRKIRFLYSQAFDGKNIPKDVENEHKAALAVVGQLWISWEKCFGSERSLVKATQRMEGKVGQILKHELDIPADEEQTSKRSKVDAEQDFERLKVQTANEEIDGASTSAAGGTAEAGGNEESKHNDVCQPTKSAHPFTVRVLKLSPATTDMELVDCFRPRCGPIVHARIIRHKDGKSKGWALIQFETRESVIKALELNDVLSIKEKIVVVERSHMPAAPLVPPGMHRVSAKGEGKVSKRNERRKQRIAIS